MESRFINMCNTKAEVRLLKGGGEGPAGWGIRERGEGLVWIKPNDPRVGKVM